MQRPSFQQAHLFRKDEDDWTGVTEQEERKKRQNRLNQRARRLRNQKTKECHLPGKRPFRVQRWRIGARASEHPPADRESSESLNTSPLPLDLDSPDFIRLIKHNQISFLQLEPILRHRRSFISPGNFNPITPPVSSQRNVPVFDFPLSPDHLLIHLIHYNVFRGLTANKALLNSKATLTKPSDQGFLPLLPSFTQFCDGLTIIEPHKEAVLPPCLYPTSLQMTFPHSSWINMFPFRRFRENLIEFEGVFDAQDLCNDLFGDIFTDNAVTCVEPSRGYEFGDKFTDSVVTSNETSAASIRKIFGERNDLDEDTVAVGRRGLIAWGEPWDKDGWEVTPGFVKKWAWLLSGCNDMIESGNRWRLKRNEEPLPLILE